MRGGVLPSVTPLLYQSKKNVSCHVVDKFIGSPWLRRYGTGGATAATKHNNRKGLIVLNTFLKIWMISKILVGLLLRGTMILKRPTSIDSQKVKPIECLIVSLTLKHNWMSLYIPEFSCLKLTHNHMLKSLFWVSQQFFFLPNPLVIIFCWSAHFQLILLNLPWIFHLSNFPFLAINISL